MFLSYCTTKLTFLLKGYSLKHIPYNKSPFLWTLLSLIVLFLPIQSLISLSRNSSLCRNFRFNLAFSSLHTQRKNLDTSTERLSADITKGDTDSSTHNQYSSFLRYFLTPPKGQRFSELNEQQLKCAIKNKRSAKTLIQ